MVKVLERINTFTTLGIQFIDIATDVPVDTGLIVTARPLNEEEPVVSAFRTRSGIYAFQKLPGLLEAEYMLVDPLDGGLERVPFLIEVSDPLDRFVPVTFDVELPFERRGLYPAAAMEESTDDPPPGFYLFTASTRELVPGLATVRAQLQRQDRSAAAHAVLELENQGRMWLGVADELGNVTIQFPYPPFTTTLVGSPPSGSTPLNEHEWQLTVRVRY